MAAMVFALSSYGDISFDQVTWNSSTLGWYNTEGVATSVDNPGGWLRMYFAVDQNPVIESDRLVNDGAGYTGDYTAYKNFHVRFQFLGYPSSAQSMILRSAVDGGSLWAYDLNVISHGWESKVVKFSSETGWSRISGSGSFASALTQIDMIGFAVEHLNLDSSFEYGLDNWQYDYFIPEPGAVSMFITALLSIAVTFRGQIRGRLVSLTGKESSRAEAN